MPATPLGFLGYAAEAFALGALFLALLIPTKRGNLAASPGGRLFLLALLTATAAALGVAAIPYYPVPVEGVIGLEVLRLTVWLCFLGFIIKDVAGRPLVGVTLLLALIGAALGLYALAEPLRERILLIVLLAFALAGLLLLERLWAGLDAPGRRTLRVLSLGLALFLAFDFLVFADGLVLNRTQSPLANARGWVGLAVVPLLAIGAVRARPWGFDVVAPREVVAYGLAVLLVAAYLLGAFAAAGFVDGLVATTAGLGVYPALLAGVAVLLLAPLLFRGLTSRLRDVVRRRLYGHRYDYRLAWKRLVDTVERGWPDDVPEQVAHAVGRIMEAAAAAVWRHDRGHFRALAGYGLPGGVLRDGTSPDFARALVHVGGLVELDYEGARSLLPPWMPPPPESWLLVPLMRGDELWGVLLLGRPRGPRALNWEDRTLLRLLGRSIIAYLAEDEAVRRLVAARRFEAFNRRSAYVVHDIKNVAGSLNLTLANARRYRGNEAFYDEMLETLEAAIERINRLITQVREGREAEPRTVDLGAMLSAFARARVGPKPRLDLPKERLDIRIDPADLEGALNPLLDNAFEAGNRVRLALSRENGTAVIAVEDNGPGMPEAFVRERLFQPFGTTKPDGLGLGLAQARDLVEHSGGRLAIESLEGRGTTVRIYLPLLRELVE